MTAADHTEYRFYGRLDTWLACERLRPLLTWLAGHTAVAPDAAQTAGRLPDGKDLERRVLGGDGQDLVVG